MNGPFSACAYILTLQGSKANLYVILTVGTATPLFLLSRSVPGSDPGLGG